jgi:protein tyrosine phosphatase
MILIDQQQLFNEMMNVYWNANQFTNPHIAAEWILKRIEQIKIETTRNNKIDTIINEPK